MKTIKQFSILIFCFSMIYGMNSCGNREKFEPNYNDCTVDVILCSDLENSVLPDSLQKLFAAAGHQQLSAGKDNSKIKYVPSGTLRRVDLNTPVELTVKYEQTVIEKIQDQLKKPKEEDIENRVDKYLQGVDAASLNSKEKVDPNEKTNRINAFIEQKQNEESPCYSKVLFYSVKPKDSSWNDNTVYHDMDTIRSIVFSSPKARYLVVYNPPAWVNVNDTVQPAIKKDTIPAKITKTKEPEKIAVTNEPTVKKDPNPTCPPCSCFVYSGSKKNCLPEGDGKMTYKCRMQIAKHDRDKDLKPVIHTAEAGDYFVGSWGNGDIVSGTLYDKKGNIKEKIFTSKRHNPYDICNDF